MSQIPPRFRSAPPTSSDPNVRLRVVPEDHYHPYQGQSSQAQDNRDPVYFDQHQATQTIKKLSFWSNTDQEREEENDWNERQSPSTFILAIVILVVASTLLWFLFRWISGEQPGTPPLISADTTPFKVRPENPGGMMIPHQDKLVYGRLSPDAPQSVERLLPPPEQLMAAPQYPSHPSQDEGQYQGQHSQGQYPQGQYQGQPYGAPLVQSPYPQEQGYPAPPQEGYTTHLGTQAPPSQMMQPPYPQTGEASGGYPALQMMHSVPPLQQDYPYGNPQAQHHPYHQPPPLHREQRPYPVPYGGSMPDPASQEAYKLGLSPQKKGSSAIEDIKPASDEDRDAEMASQEGQMELDALIAKEVEIPVMKSSKRVTDNSLKPTPLDPSRSKVQIASLPSRALAEKEMKRLKANYGYLFGNRPWNIQKIDLGSGRGTTYRLVVGSFANRGNAVKFCSKLRAERIGCMIVAPAGQ